MIDTTRKACFYDAVSKTVLKNHLSNEGGGISIIQGRKIIIYDAHSKAVTKNHLRIEPSGIFVNSRNKTTPVIAKDRP